MTNLGYHSSSSPKPYFKDEAKLPQVKHSIAPRSDNKSTYQSIETKKLGK